MALIYLGEKQGIYNGGAFELESVTIWAVVLIK